MPGIGMVYTASFIPSQDIGNVTAETQFKNSQGAQANLVLPADGQFINSRLKIRLGGRVATTSNLTFTVNLYFGTSATIASNTLLLSSGAQTVNTKKTNWHIDVDLFWDGDSNTFCGIGSGQMSNGPIGPSALSNVPSANPNVRNTISNAATAYGFTVTGQFSGSSSGNHSFLDIFNVELL